MTHSQRTTITKAGRLACLLILDDCGKLRGKSLRDIAVLFNVQRSTILRDKRILAQVRLARDVAMRRIEAQ